MHAYAGDCFCVRSVLLRYHLVIFHGHRCVIQALEYAAHLCEDCNIIREVFEAPLARVQRSHWLIEPNVDSDQPQNRFDTPMIFQR